MNRIELIGRLTKDADIRQTQSGKTVAAFTLAVNRPFAKKDSGQQTADFIRCQAWERTADVLRQYTHKGSQIGVSGRLQTREYDDKDGKRQFVSEVIVEQMDLLEKRQEAASQPASQTGYSGYSQRTDGFKYDPNVRPSQGNPYAPDETLDLGSDDLPF
ncbi:single-stranded DNA-binding protein [Faecalibaculum rodentium]|uniref:single-stranded DNA-binding protein n=1 Tax=Faecalibaculum rodentium TaxID=1702221 RepID=UPI00272EF83A|nr:single-stranded DNA-binding protein [Faecalibaculum rodentium]